jgi:hypothetical protein
MGQCPTFHTLSNFAPSFLTLAEPLKWVSVLLECGLCTCVQYVFGKPPDGTVLYSSPVQVDQKV